MKLHGNSTFCVISMTARKRNLRVIVLFCFNTGHSHFGGIFYQAGRNPKMKIPKQ